MATALVGGLVGGAMGLIGSLVVLPLVTRRAPTWKGVVAMTTGFAVAGAVTAGTFGLGINQGWAAGSAATRIALASGASAAGGAAGGATTQAADNLLHRRAALQGVVPAAAAGAAGGALGGAVGGAVVGPSMGSLPRVLAGGAAGGASGSAGGQVTRNALGGRPLQEGLAEAAGTGAAMGLASGAAVSLPRVQEGLVRGHVVEQHGDRSLTYLPRLNKNDRALLRESSPTASEPLEQTLFSFVANERVGAVAVLPLLATKAEIQQLVQANPYTHAPTFTQGTEEPAPAQPGLGFVERLDGGEERAAAVQPLPEPPLRVEGRLRRSARAIHLVVGADEIWEVANPAALLGWERKDLTGVVVRAAIRVLREPAPGQPGRAELRSDQWMSISAPVLLPAPARRPIDRPLGE